MNNGFGRTYRVERSTAEPKARVGVTVYHPRKKTPSIQTGTSKQGTGRKTTGSKTFVFELPPFPGIPRHPGERATRPRKGAFLRPPLAEFDGDLIVSRGIPRAAVWDGRWHGRARGRGGYGGVRESRCSAGRGILKQRNWWGHLDITVTTTYCINR